MLVGRATSSTNTRTVKDMTTGVTGSTTSTFLANPLVQKLRIGSAYSNASYTNANDIALAIKYSRSLSDAELITLYAWAKIYFASRGITV
jgi:hypothetical protein